MRDLVQFPISYQDVLAALDRAVDSAHLLANDEDVASLGYLRSYLQQHGNAQALGAHIDKEQPKPSRPGVEYLTPSELEILAKRAHPFGGRHAPDEMNIWAAGYKGISNRGSHVFDLNEGYGSRQVRVYIRDMKDGLRAEFREDNFNLPLAETPKIGCHVNEEEPVSALADWFRKLLRF